MNFEIEGASEEDVAKRIKEHRESDDWLPKPLPCRLIAPSPHPYDPGTRIEIGGIDLISTSLIRSIQFTMHCDRKNRLRVGFALDADDYADWDAGQSRLTADAVALFDWEPLVELVRAAGYTVTEP